MTHGTPPTKGQYGLTLLLGFVAGIVGGQPPRLGVLVGVCAVVGVGLVLWFGARGSLLAAIFLVAALLGFGRAWWATAPKSPRHVAGLIGRPAGDYVLTVVNDVRVIHERSTQFTARLAQRDSATGATATFRRHVAVTLRGSEVVAVGDILTVHGAVTAPEFSSAAAELRYPTIKTHADGELSLRRALFFLERMLVTRLRAQVPEPHASLLAGILLGDRGGFSDTVATDLRGAGLSHIVVVSGMNLLIMAQFFQLATARWARPRGAAVATATGVWLFTLLTGAGSSTLRAAVMVTLLIVLKSFGRVRDPVRVILCMIALLLCWDPTFLTDVGFALSVGATAGILFWSPGLKRAFQRVPELWGGREALVMSLAAQIGVLPVLLFQFGRIASATPLANIIVVPLLTPLTVLAAAVVLLPAAVAHLAAGTATLFTGLIFGVAHLGSRLPTVPLSVSRTTMLLFYALLGGVTWSARAATRRQWRQTRAAASTAATV